MIAMQELIWAVRPDLIIETGIAHGGSLSEPVFPIDPLR
jgi:cephalosporin hydroxylase